MAIEHAKENISLPYAVFILFFKDNLKIDLKENQRC